MTIVFTNTRATSWRALWRNWAHRSLRPALRLLALPVLAYGICYFGGFGLLLSKISAAVVGIVPLGAGVLAVLDLLRKVRQWRREVLQEQVAEAGKFDFRWGRQGTNGYYHHWSYFTDLADRDGSLFFVLGTGETFRIPRQAFPTSKDAGDFFALACRRWEAAKQNQRHALTAEEGVWPPAPRVG
jgi:hypothetical protein